MCKADARGIEIRVDKSVYSIDALLRTCYRFTDRAYVLLQEIDGSAIEVHLVSRCGADLDDIIGEFSNVLLDEELRDRLNNETRHLRELVVAQAFAESDLPDDFTSADFHEDPRGIAR